MDFRKDKLPLKLETACPVCQGVGTIEKNGRPSPCDCDDGLVLTARGEYVLAFIQRHQKRVVGKKA